MHWDKQQPANKLGNCEGDDHPKTKKSKIQDALTDVLAIPAYPINTLLHPLVRKFCSVMNPKVDLPRSFNTLKALLLSKCSTVQKATKKALEGIRSKPSITCDCWTDKSMKHSYLGATLHCIDKNITLRRFFSGLKELEGSHTRFLLRRKTEELLAEHGLKMKNVYKIITNSGSNILSAFKDVLLCLSSNTLSFLSFLLRITYYRSSFFHLRVQISGGFGAGCYNCAGYKRTD